MAVEDRTLAVVIPSYKAADSIADVVARIPVYVDWIIVVNDASPDVLDGTMALIRDPRIVYLRHDVNRGVGGAMVSGYREAIRRRANYVAKIDSDGQMDPQFLNRFVRAAVLHDCDYVKANRFGHLDAIQSMPRTRLWGNVLLSFLTKMASGYWNVFDPQNGYVMISDRALARIDLSRIDESYFFENSMLINLNIIRAKVAEIHIPAKYGNEISSLVLRRILTKFPGKLLAGYMHRVYQKYVIRSLSPYALLLLFAFPCLLWGIGWGVYSWIISVKTGVPATTGTVILALLPFMVGWSMLLQALAFDIQDTGPSVLVDCDDKTLFYPDD
jgi:dolichol-phosphate mannosyltransferase